MFEYPVVVGSQEDLANKIGWKQSNSEQNGLQELYAVSLLSRTILLKVLFNEQG
jgi:hypothetical protein